MIGREAHVIAVALLTSMAAGSVLILLYGQSPGHVYGQLLADTWGSSIGFGQVLAKATPLVFTGLAVSVAYRAGLFNIGGEGQMVAGAFATAVAGAALPAATPWLVAVPLAVFAGAAAGGMLGAIPGALRARFGAHEVITTIMLNFIAGGVALWIGNTWLFVGESTHTARVVPGAWLPELGLSGSAANMSWFLALVVCAGVWYIQNRTRTGFEQRAVGLSSPAAEAAGVRIGRSVVIAMASGGALAGLVGTHYVLGYKHYFEQDMGRGFGFMGIAVALLGRLHPAGIVLAALLLGTLSAGGLVVSALVPKELWEVLQAVIILALIATSAEARLFNRGVARAVRGLAGASGETP